MIAVPPNKLPGRRHHASGLHRFIMCGSWSFLKSAADMADMTTLDNCEDLSNATIRPVTEISRQGRAIMTTAPTAAAIPRNWAGFRAA